ncbi:MULTISPECIES: serine--tRNA ligase [Reichenbachiella]|uniref:Serine--tRNA ligase n=1 Tax=Reichenbachiella agariperforans TaxID=156994 RepID=A0A1M6NPP2_REIAG|nr:MULTISPECIES: serine--tRNA ligase [Reichenbachiella]MBU2915982.1 serine--tRNA ligase [Reichenbachiella agariperforans]RJE71779.1 serine--tRNA ligase [Reichenbachiella sp. MSK19-1]SHJ97707.1 seryl-tRNA synthetase [Reichenbachiella agariperforans]
MLLVSEVVEHKDRFVAGLVKRGIDNAAELLDNIIALDDKRKSTQAQLDELLSESNKLSKSIGMLMKDGKKEEAEAVKQKTADIKAQSKDLTQQLEDTKNELLNELYQTPNIPNPDVPAGKTEDDNEEIFCVKTLPDLGEDAKPHWDLIKEYDIIDFDLGIKITGAGFPVYKGKGARLQRALVNFFLDEAEKAGYQEIQPPVVVNEASGLGTGQLPDKEGQMYHLSDTDMYLIPTAEVPLTNLYRDVILDEKELPIKNVGFTPCFRKEAGSWGAHVRGLNRLHQFDKVEIVQIEHPDKSFDTLDQMVKHVEGLLKKLDLPYRILKLCAGDLGFTSSITYDFEVYSAGQKRWLEVSSVSNFKNYQANRLKLRYKDADNKKHLLHTLNGSALALPRIMAAILENGQKANGIELPAVLKNYTGFDRID